MRLLVVGSWLLAIGHYCCCRSSVVFVCGRVVVAFSILLYRIIVCGCVVGGGGVRLFVVVVVYISFLKYVLLVFDSTCVLVCHCSMFNDM